MLPGFGWAAVYGAWILVPEALASKQVHVVRCMVWAV